MRTFTLFATLGLSSLVAVAAPKAKESATAEKPRPDAFIDRKLGEPAKAPQNTTKWDAMEVGPFFSSGLGGEHPACKSISIKVDGTNAAVSFDTELLRMTAGWTGGFVKLPKGRGGLEGFPAPIGTTVFSTPSVPGWAKNGSFKDPRRSFRRYNYGTIDKKLVPFPMEIVYGRLPNDWAHWKGLYLNGDKVILNYSVGKADVLEMPGFTKIENLPVFTRIFEISSGSKMELAICEAESTEGTMRDGRNTVACFNKDTNGVERFTAAAIIGAPDKAAIDIKDNMLVLKVPSSSKTRQFKVLVCSGERKDIQTFWKSFRSSESPVSLKALCAGGKSHWGEPLATKGHVGTGSGEYVVDTITLPEQNPFKSWLRPSGFDFFSDGRAAVCSVSGDVWIVSGIDDTLQNLKWQRFATGLFQPLGLKIVKDEVYVACRDEIVRLHDLNHDGEADFYENFNNDISITPHYHEFLLNLETDSRGNFYFCKGSNLREAGIPQHGTLQKLSADGKKLETICIGLRAPNGLSVGPHDEITVSDNEGGWTPASRINLVKKGGFYGNVYTGYTDKPRTHYDNPLLWLQHGNNIDNSSGGQVWVTSDKWGPLNGHLLHTSYGTCSLFEIMMENVDGTSQAAAMKFPLKFESGIMRGRFSPFDGQLYLCGLSVWQSNAAKEGCFQRVRYTGKTVHMPTEFHVKPRAIEITFSCALDTKTASDVQNFSIEQWNYKWSHEYGSKEYSVKNPSEVKHDPVEIKSVKLSADKKTVTLELAEAVKPVMQMKIAFNIDAEDGAMLKQEIFNSIFKVPGSKIASN